jgi:nicotinate dehydrogenase subunit B
MSRIEERIRIEPDGSVTAFSGKTEYGQGLRAAFPRIVAEELGIAPSQVKVVLGETDVVPWDMGTFGSLSVWWDGMELRRAAAFARLLLLSRAADKLQASLDDLDVVDSQVRSRATGRTLNFGELTSGKPLVGEVPEEVKLAIPTPTCADSPLGPDARDFVTGKAQFVGDVRLPGMLHGCVLHPAAHGAKLLSIDREAAMALPGVVTMVHEGDFAGIVAERRHQVLAAAQALKPVWAPRPAAATRAVEVPIRSDAGVQATLRARSNSMRQHYFTPHIANVPIGPAVAIVDVRADGADVYAATQVPFRVRDDVSRVTGLTPERVHFHPKAMSGGYGRYGATDAAVEAARLSKAAGHPVLVQWTRGDEFHAAPNRPEMTADLSAALDEEGRISLWRFEAWTNPYVYDGADFAGAAQSGSAPARAWRPGGPGGRRPTPLAARGSEGGGGWSPEMMLAMMCGRNAEPPYELNHAEILLHISPAAIRTGAMRSLGASPNVFAIESFVDELAASSRQDPIAFRLRHTRDRRLRMALETVRDHSGWENAPRGQGRGLGVACVIYGQTYVAEVAEVSVSDEGVVRLQRVWCAIDPGHVVHPDGARNQVEGAIQMGASWALLEALPHHGDEITASTLDDYPIATFRDAPQSIDVVFTGDDLTASSGIGEPPAVPIGAAIANAVFDACGARIRQLPIRPEAVRRALEER